MVKRILFQFPGHDHGKLFDPQARDATLHPFIYLRDALRSLGYDLCTLDNHRVEESWGILFWDVPPIPQTALDRLKKYLKPIVLRLLGRPMPERSIYSECVRLGMRERGVFALFIGEPPVVMPRNWNKSLHTRFNQVFTWNDNYVDNKTYFKFHWPQTGLFQTVEELPFPQKKLLVNISGNKTSNHPDELYTSRRKTIRYFEGHLPDQFDLYGTGWDKLSRDEAPYTSYRGMIKHKWDVYPRYRFGICYENMRNAAGWITEKIFDCMRAGCVPVYWGPSNTTQFIDPETFIDRSQFDSESQLAAFLVEMSEADYHRYREAARDYLSSEKFKVFLPPAFAENIIRVLKLDGEGKW